MIGGRPERECKNSSALVDRLGWGMTSFDKEYEVGLPSPVTSEPASLENRTGSLPDSYQFAVANNREKPALPSKYGELKRLVHWFQHADLCYSSTCKLSYFDDANMSDPLKENQW